MKLKLYLHHYLPYSLNGYKTTTDRKTGKEIPSIKGLTPFNMDTWCRDANPYKPILYPLSDLKKSKYNYIRDEMTLFDIDLLENAQFHQIKSIDALSYKSVEVLVKNRFDIFELIESGDAVDINTLKLEL